MAAAQQPPDQPPTPDTPPDITQHQRPTPEPSLRPAPPKAVSLSYMPQLDGLRGITIWLVLYTHFIPWDHPLRSNTSFGEPAIRWFFVLSGFLIFQLLLKAKRSVQPDDNVWPGWPSIGKALGAFYWRRLLRLSGPYFTYIALAAWLVPAMVEYLPYYLTYTQNFLFAFNHDAFFGESHGFDEHGLPNARMPHHFWTLAIEEQFYLVAPIAMLLLPARRHAPVLLATILLSLAFKLAMLSPAVGQGLETLHAQSHTTVMLLPSQMDFFALGGLIGLSATARRWFTPRLTLLWFGLRVALKIATVAFDAAHARNPDLDTLAQALYPTRYVAEHALEGMMGAGLTLMGAKGFGGWLGRLLTHGVWLYFGKISYSLYVYHLNVPDLWERLFVPLGLPAMTPESSKDWIYALRMLVFTIISIGLASLSHFLIETPLQKLRKLFG